MLLDCAPNSKMTLKQTKENLLLISYFTSVFLKNYYTQIFLEKATKIIEQEILVELVFQEGYEFQSVAREIECSNKVMGVAS